MNNQIAADNFMRVLSEGRMIRGAFNQIAPDGRKLACAFAAAIPGAESTADCPAAVMPQWVADLTLWLDDAGTPPDDTETSVWYKNMLRYGTVMYKWHVLSPEDWGDISRRFRAQCCISALASARAVTRPDAEYWPAVVKASEDISACLLAGHDPTADMITAAARGAWAAGAAGAAGAEWAAAWAARGAWAAWAAAKAAAAAATWAEAAAADSLIDHFLSLVEDAVARKLEGKK